MGPWIALAALALLGCGASQPGAPSQEWSVPAWMVGAWRAVTDDGVTEETWVDAGGYLVGFNRSRDAEGRTTHHETLRLDVDGYVAAPTGQAVTRFGTGPRAANRARFENPTHDFPRWIEYVRDGDALVARIGGDDDEAAAEWRFERTATEPQRVQTPARACRDAEGLRVTIEPCYCAAELYCAELEGELVVTLIDQSCDGCAEASGVCHAQTTLGPSSGCADLVPRVLLLSGD